MSRQLAQLRMEFTAYRLQSHQSKVRRLEVRLARAVSERGLADQEERTNRDDLSNAGLMLARNDLTQAERTELEKLRDGLIAEASAAVRHRQDTTAETEAALRRQLGHERAIAEELEKRMRSLQQAATH
jgi:hypothetical protein